MLPISESYSKVKNAFSENFTHFPVIKKTIEQFAFEINNFSVFFICHHSCRISVICTHFLSPSPKDALCQVCWNWPNGSRENFYNFVNIFSYFVIISLGKWCGPSFEKLQSPLLKDALCQVWLKLAQWFWRRRCKCEKFTGRQMDEKITNHLLLQISKKFYKSSNISFLK